MHQALCSCVLCMWHEYGNAAQAVADIVGVKIVSLLENAGKLCDELKIIKEVAWKFVNVDSRF